MTHTNTIGSLSEDDRGGCVMSLYIIGEVAETLTKGEKFVLNKLKELYKAVNYDAYLYVQMKIGKLVPGYILIDQMRGIGILEVRDWEASHVKASDKKIVQLLDKEEENPVYRTKKHLDLLNGMIANRDEELEFVSEYVYANTMMVYLSQKESEKIVELQNSLKARGVNCHYKEQMKSIQIEDFFSDEEIHMTEQQIQEIRVLLFPEVKIVPKQELAEVNTVQEIKTFDVEQEKFAKRIPYGHYMVTGIPGSGKTVILIARAIHLIRENPHWRVCILTYNKSLQTKLEEKINAIARTMASDPFQSHVPIQNIEVKTFHAMAKQVANVQVPYKASDEWWRETLPHMAYERAMPIYDAVLIDEYQDFYQKWIQVCLKICKTQHYVNGRGESVEGINVFLAGDRLQSIYNEEIVSWRSMGIDMRGRSKLLKVSYRTGHEHIELALKFLQENDMLKREVKEFYKDEEEEDTSLRGMMGQGNIHFVEGDDESIIRMLEHVMKEGAYGIDDILIVGRMNKRIQVFRGKLRGDMSGVECVTYQSAKGLENKVVVLLDMDEFQEDVQNKKDILMRKTVYVGMTRSSEVLIMHGKNQDKESFYKTIRELEKSES